jgi:hypothetical protein
MRYSLTILILLTISLSAQPKFESTNAAPGEFSRMGFLPRGVAMGNAMSAVNTGSVSAFYNPALPVFQEGNDFQAAYTFLSLDRHLNFLNFSRRFDFYSSKDTSAERKPISSAGISFGIINSGVSSIEERNEDGIKTGDLSTSENLFFLSFANRFSKKFAVGVTAKLYYYKLYESMSATAMGLDIGCIYSIQDNLRVSFVLADLNAKYKWDSSNLYGTDGTITQNNFPETKKLGVSYFETTYGILFAGEFEFNNYGRKLLRCGAEYQIYENLYLRGGLDNIVLNNSDEVIQPSGGFAYFAKVGNYTLGVEYGLAAEQYSNGMRHTAGLHFIF